MMFNGARKYGPGQFDIEMARNGGDNNAYTTPDLTAYTDWVPRPALELALEMEADRLAHLSFDPAIVESERQVVVSERRTTVDNSNEGLLLEQLYATAYIAHPYRWPVIGWASDIAGWTAADLARHYRTGYAPNNCTVIAVGDVRAEEFLALARRHLEPIPRHEPPPEVRTREPQQMGERRAVIHKRAQMPLQLFALAHAGLEPRGLLAAAGSHLHPCRRAEFAPLPPAGGPRPTGAFRRRLAAALARPRAAGFERAAARDGGARTGRGSTA